MVRAAADKKANNIQARSLVARNLEAHVRRSSTKRKAEVGYRKTKLDNARKLRGIYFIDPTDAEVKETIENSLKKLEVPMPAAMPCKIRRSKHGEICSSS